MIVLEGVLMTFDQMTSGGRIYSKDVFNKEVQRYLKKQLQKNRLKKLDKINKIS